MLSCDGRESSGSEDPYEPEAAEKFEDTAWNWWKTLHPCPDGKDPESCKRCQIDYVRSIAMAEIGKIDG